MRLSVTPRTVFDSMMDLVPFICPICHQSYMRGFFKDEDNNQEISPYLRSMYGIIEEHVQQCHSADYICCSDQFQFDLSLKKIGSDPTQSAIVILKHKEKCLTLLGVCVKDSKSKTVSIALYRMHGITTDLSCEVVVQIGGRCLKWNGSILESTSHLNDIIGSTNAFHALLETGDELESKMRVQIQVAVGA